MDFPFEPISFDPAPGFRDPGATPPKKRRGGARPGAGAPKGNLNALKHGRNSKQHQRLVGLLVQIPEVREALTARVRRQRRATQQLKVEAARILLAWAATIARQSPPGQDNQLENNQRLNRILNVIKAQIAEIEKKQSPTKRP